MMIVNLTSNNVKRYSGDTAIVPTKQKQAYPILINEWGRLKSQIKNMKEYDNVFSTISSVLLSIAGSALLTILTLGVVEMGDDVSVPMYIIVVWFIFGLSLSCGLTTLSFSRNQRNNQKSRGSEIVEHMEFIEETFVVQKEAENK